MCPSSYPQQITPQRQDWIVSSVDIMPTLLGLCGCAIPEAVQGMNYASTFLGTSQAERQDAFLFNVQKNDKGSKSDWRGIRTKWTYAYHLQGDWVLYHLLNDPYQLHNLIDDPQYSALNPITTTPRNHSQGSWRSTTQAAT